MKYTFENVSAILTELNPKISFFKDGDFGDISRIEIDKGKAGLILEFWSKGWLTVYLIDYERGEEVINKLLEPTETTEQQKALEEVFQILGAKLDIS